MQTYTSQTVGNIPRKRKGGVFVYMCTFVVYVYHILYIYQYHDEGFIKENQLAKPPYQGP